MVSYPYASTITGHGTVRHRDFFFLEIQTVVPRRRPLELDQFVVSAIRGEEGSSVLEVFALRITLQRLVARLVEPVCQEDAPVGSR